MRSMLAVEGMLMELHLATSWRYSLRSLELPQLPMYGMEGAARMGGEDAGRG